MESLTPKQQLFVDHYLTTFNATESARRAGYKGNDVTLGAVGAENLKKPQIISLLTKRFNQVAAKHEKKIVNTYDEFTQNLEFVSKLRDACDKWLADPDNPDAFSINPRGDEIDVVYFDYEDKDAQGNPKRKTESLQEILARLQGTRYDSDTQFVKTADIREFALKTIDRIDTAIDKFAKIEGIYTADKSNPADLSTLADVVKRYRADVIEQARIFEGTNGKFGAAMPTEAEMRGEIERLCRHQKVDYAKLENHISQQELGSVG